jgi:thiamine kinase-like enzyme
MGDRYFDLGNLAVNNDFDDAQEMALLEAYFGDVQPHQQRRLRSMRLASDLREASWGFLQAAISRLNEDFMDYGRRHLDRFMRRATNS